MLYWFAYLEKCRKEVAQEFDLETHSRVGTIHNQLAILAKFGHLTQFAIIVSYDKSGLLCSHRGMWGAL